jgi:GNAT superfamily N-acetyltransferase
MLEAQDKSGWLRLFRAYLVFYKTILSEKQIDLTWSRLLGQEDGLFGLIALDPKDKPIGIANILFHRSTWAEHGYCYLEDLYVEKTARRCGAGRALLGATFAEAARRGAADTYWATDKDNAAARALYDKVGKLTPFLQYKSP